MEKVSPERRREIAQEGNCYAVGEARKAPCQDPLESSRWKLARAKHHIQDLEGKIESFSEGKPYHVSVEPDPQVPNKQFHTIKLIMPPPASFSGIAGDAANNLRAVLDHAAYAVAVASGKPKPREAYFPIGGTERYWGQSIGRCKDVPQDIRTFFGGFKPYQGGNDLLWGLNQICITDKHMQLVSIMVRLGGANFSAAYQKGICVSYTRPTWDSSKNQITFESVKPEGAQINYGFKLVLDVEFRETQLFAGQPAVSVLYAMAGEVERVLLGIEAESRRLGIIT